MNRFHIVFKMFSLTKKSALPLYPIVNIVFFFLAILLLFIRRCISTLVIIFILMNTSGHCNSEVLKMTFWRETLEK